MATINLLNEEQIKQAILRDLNLQDAPQSVQEQTIVKITEMALKQLMIAVLEKLNESDAQELVRMQENGASQEKLTAFVKSKIPDFDSMAQQTMQKFKEDFKKTVTDVK
ncbi:MAG: hypothetical protein WC752_03300 [Patescibacteria group bacterium]|jgi:hypothetical protein